MPRVREGEDAGGGADMIRHWDKAFAVLAIFCLAGFWWAMLGRPEWRYRCKLESLGCVTTEKADWEYRGSGYWCPPRAPWVSWRSP